jgi:hypothetical protein
MFARRSEFKQFLNHVTRRRSIRERHNDSLWGIAFNVSNPTLSSMEAIVPVAGGRELITPVNKYGRPGA